MKLVKNWEDLKRNLLSLDEYRTSTDVRSQKYFQDTIRAGHCFVVCRVAGRLLFGPSRFIGYSRNTRAKHSANTTKHGSETNQRIQKLLAARFHPSPSDESEFLKFCRKHSITPQRNRRKYIHYGQEIFANDVDLIAGDIKSIQKDKTLSITEKKRLSSARIGQGEFRRRVQNIWGSCLVTGCGVQVLLRASHIKPWKNSSNVERLDGFNGLLLAPQVDAAFDRGLITFDKNGSILLSPSFPVKEAKLLGLTVKGRASFTQAHQKYLEYHRQHVFRG